LPKHKEAGCKVQELKKKSSFSYRFYATVLLFVLCFSCVGYFLNSYDAVASGSSQHHGSNFFQKLVQHGAAHNHNNRKGPFAMPIKSQTYEFFQPFYDMDEAKKDTPFIAPPQDFIQIFKKRIEWVDPQIKKKTKLLKTMNVEEHAAFMYIQMIKSFVSGVVFNEAEMSVRGWLNHNYQRTQALDLELRKQGKDWTYAGDTMTGWARLDNVYNLLKDVIENGIEGDYIETGVWRGGSSLFAKATMMALDPSSRRVSYVCDSFRGLPPGNQILDKADVGWDGTPYLEVTSEVVANNFIKYGMLDENVVFVKGFFNETMPPLKEKVDRFSIMRLDGDMYESTVDVLYNLYDKLTLGGYVIMDDWLGFPSKTAVEDFFQVHGEDLPDIVAIDDLSAYWKKTKDFKINYERYQKAEYKKL